MSNIVVGPNGQRPSALSGASQAISRGLTQISLTARAFAAAPAQLSNPVRRGSITSPADKDGGSLSLGIDLPNGAFSPRRKRPVSREQLISMYKCDPVTNGLVTMTRSLINQIPWKVVPDCVAAYKELDRWEDLAADCANEWGYVIDFKSTVLSAQLVGEIGAEVTSILKTGKKDTDANRKKRQQIASLFRVVKRGLLQEAEYACGRVRPIFDCPNKQTEKSLRALLDLVVKDILLDDSGIIIKNYDEYGSLAELYTPFGGGHQIRPIIFPDGTVPQPPQAAYFWYDNQRVRAWYSNKELTYIMANPQGNGYGLSPLEVLAQVNMATIMGDTKFIENLIEGFTPPFMINLKGATPKQRANFEQQLFGQMKKGGGNRGIVLSDVPSEDGEFQYQEIKTGSDFSKIQLKEYLAMAPSIKAFTFGYMPQDVGVAMQAAAGQKIDSSTLGELSNRRAVLSILTLLREYMNAEIVKQEFPNIKNVSLEPQIPGAQAVDPLKQEQAYSVALAAGRLTINETREKDNLRPIPGGHVATKATGNAIIPIDFMDGMDSDLMAQLSGQNAAGDPAQPGVVPPAVKTDPKKRNNANSRQQSLGSPTQKSLTVDAGGFVKVADFDEESGQ